MAETATFVTYANKGPGDSMSIPFTYRSQSHVKVYADDVLLSSSLYSFTNASTITAGGSFPESDEVRIVRDTPIDPFDTIEGSGKLFWGVSNTNFDKARRSLEEHRDLIDDHTERLDVAEDSLVAHDDRLDTAEGTITSHGNRLNAAESTIAAHTGQIAAADSSIAGIQGTLEDHQNQLDDTLKVAEGTTIGVGRAPIMGSGGRVVAGPTADEIAEAQGYAEQLVNYATYFDPDITGISAPFVSMRDILRHSLSATSCKLLGDDSSDNHPELMNILNDIELWGGGRFHINMDRSNGGVYRVSGSVDLPGNVILYGDGDRAAMLKATGDYPLIQTIGDGDNVINRGGVRDLCLWGGGRTNPNAAGIKISWTNRQVFQNVRIHACRRGFEFDNIWQVFAQNVSIDGGGDGQNHDGFYGHPVDPSNPNNALIAVGCVVQNAANHGYRLMNFNGSKFTNCEVAGAGGHGWYLGAPDVGTEIVQWGHFSDILSDSCVGDLFRVERGSASVERDFQVNGLWLGTSYSNHGLHVLDSSGLQVSGVMARSIRKSAVYYERSSRCSMTGFSLKDFDTEGASNPGILLTDSQRNDFSGGQIYAPSSAGTNAFTETGTSDFNKLSCVDTDAHGITLVGTSSDFAMVDGEYAFRYGRAGANHAAAVTADNGREVFLGLGTQASPLTHSIKRTTTNQMDILTNGTSRFRVGSGVGTSEFLNSNLQPMRDYVTTVSGLVASPDGTRAFVTDATQSWPADTGTTVTGGGTNSVPVVRVGGAWKVA